MRKTFKAPRNPSDNKCIFCSEAPLTDEHLFADWLRKIIPREEKMHWHVHRHNLSSGPDEHQFVKRTDLFSLKVPVVCRACNSGWMSRIQGEAKDLAAPIIQGRDIVLDRHSLRALASWITMMTMVAEFLEPDLQGVAISQTERTNFKEHRRPLANWKIWIGKYWRADGRLYTHAAAKHRQDPTEQFLDDCDSQASIFVMGHLFVRVFRSQSGIPYEVGKWVEHLRPLHASTRISFPFGPSITGEEGVQIHKTFGDGPYRRR